MFKRTLVLTGVITIIMYALLIKLYPRLSEISRTRVHLGKTLALVGVSTVAGLLIMGLIKTQQRE
jgi:hypothetical protein